MRIAFVHTKGGVGKTTSTVLLATAAARKGIDVTVFDTDPQGSLSRWAEVADYNEDRLEFPVKQLSAKELRSLPKSDGWQIIDTPPGQADEIQAAIDTADFIIVPTHASPIDIDRVWPTLETVTNRPSAVLLIGVDERRRLYRAARELFEEQGVATFETPVLDREEIRNMFGSNPENLHALEAICEEILALEKEGVL